MVEKSRLRREKLRQEKELSKKALANDDVREKRVAEENPDGGAGPDGVDDDNGVPAVERNVDLLRVEQPDDVVVAAATATTALPTVGGGGAAVAVTAEDAAPESDDANLERRSKVLKNLTPNQQWDKMAQLKELRESTNRLQRQQIRQEQSRRNDHGNRNGGFLKASDMGKYDKHVEPVKSIEVVQDFL